MINWSPRSDSNRRPADYKSAALSTELQGQIGGGDEELPLVSLILVFKYSFTCLNNFVLWLTKGNKVLLTYPCLESYLL